MKSHFPVCFVLMLALLFSTGVAVGNDKKEARVHLKKADKLFKAGEYERAVIEYERSYELNPDFKVLHKIGDAEAALNNNKRAIASYTRFLKESGNKIGKGRRNKVQAKIDQLKTEMKQAKYKGAAKKKAAALFKQGVKYKKQGQLDRAAKIFVTAHETYPNYKILYSLGTTLSALKQHKKALEALNSYLEEGGEKISSKKRVGVESEIARLEKLVARDTGKTNAKTKFEDGRRFYSKQQYERAILAYEKAYDLYPSYKFLLSIGKTRSKLGRSEKALEAYKGYLEGGGGKIKDSRRVAVKKEIARLEKIVGKKANRDESEEHYKKGLAFYNDGKYKEASAEYTQAYKLYPDFAYLYNFAQVKTELKEYSKAVKAYRRYLSEGDTKIPRARRQEVERSIKRLDPLVAKEENKSKSTMHFKKGIAYNKKGKHKKAVAEFEKAYELYPTYKILFSLGKAEAKRDNSKKAIDAYTRYLEEGGPTIDADRREKVEKEIAGLREIEEKSANKDKAREHFDQGVGFRKASDYESASKEFEEAYALYPTYKFLYSIAQVEVKLGNNEKALDAYTRYLAEGSDNVSGKKRVKAEKEIERIKFKLGRAEDKAKSREHFEKGTGLLAQEQFESAISEFEQAYDLYPSYKILYQLAQSYVGADQYTKAIKTYGRYLEKGDAKIPSKRSQKVKAEIKRLYSLVGIIELECAVRDADVLVDNEKQGKTPLTDSIIVDPGSHDILVRIEDNELYRKQTTLKAGERIALQVKTDFSVGTIEVAESAEEEEMLEGTTPEEEETEPPKRLWTWVAFGVGGGALIGSVITGSLAISKKNDILDKCPNNECPASEKDAIDDDRSKVRALGITTDVLIGTAIAGAAAGTLLFFFEPKLMSGNEVSVSPTASSDFAGISLSGKF
ncbi:MAG: tetratricopeptide repeat protein [Deltaproteobacteria bacterium]|nr:tetratricopeptide repeat protein [Deltaproteobacteria bacterium]